MQFYRSITLSVLESNIFLNTSFYVCKFSFLFLLTTWWLSYALSSHNVTISSFNTNCMFHILMKVGKKKVVVLLHNLRYIRLLQIWHHSLHNHAPIATLTLALVLLVSAVCILVLQVNWVVQCLVVQGGRVVRHLTPHLSVQIHYTGIHPVRYVTEWWALCFISHSWNP